MAMSPTNAASKLYSNPPQVNSYKCTVPEMSASKLSKGRRAVQQGSYMSMSISMWAGFHVNAMKLLKPFSTKCNAISY